MAKHGLWAAASLALSLTATTAQAAPDLGAANARLSALLDKNYPALEALYKDLHQHPELGMQEVRTAGILAQHLRKAGFTVTEKVGGTGVVAVLRNGAGPVLMIRTDMDGLPVAEETGLPFASKVRVATDEAGIESGVMHACGHDTHMSAWIGTLRNPVVAGE